jgi:hypothetical protein
MAKVIVKPGSAVAKRLLSDKPEDTDALIKAEGSKIEIKNGGKPSVNASATPYIAGSGISGYYNWLIPE